jgi:chromosome segregation ATPase
VQYETYPTFTLAFDVRPTLADLSTHLTQTQKEMNEAIWKIEEEMETLEEKVGDLKLRIIELEDKVTGLGLSDASMHVEIEELEIDVNNL